MIRTLHAALAMASLAIATCSTKASADAAVSPFGAVNIPGPIVTAHKGTFGGKRVKYEAVVEPFDVTDTSGKPVARLVSTSYIAKDGDATTRPVLFVFNGGPIVATTPLHMGAFGPKRVAIPDDISVDPATFKVVDNVYAPLDVADVVIFDPANTGFSRTLPGVAPESQFSVVADGRQLTNLVQQWAKTHRRLSSPKYLVGESYGTMRAVEAAEQLQKAGMPLDGIMLLGQAVNIIEYAQRPGNILSYVVSLPTLAAIAWSHNVADRNGRTFDQFIKDAQDYGAGEYLNVLFLGNTAAPERRQAVARKLQEFTGLSAQTYLERDLKITKVQYQQLLFPGYVLDTNDARYKRPVAQGNHDEELPGYASRYSPAAIEHFQKELKVPDIGTYFTGMPTAGAGLNGWNWGPNKSPFGDWPYVTQVRDVMKANPKFRVFVGNGYYDTQTTIGAMDYLVSQAGWPMDRVRSSYYQGGHLFYTVEASLQKLSNDVRAMVTRQW
jgi:carboxypeptidase C (cathepsin A)